MGPDVFGGSALLIIHDWDIVSEDEARVHRDNRTRA
jgi:hypothetical protein